MSNVPFRDDWWQASDGKWYAPEQHPDPNYGKSTLPPPPAKPPSEGFSTQAVGKTLAVLVVVGLVLVGVLGVAGVLGSDSSGGPSDITAQIMCEKFIGDRLKAPATADYTHVDTVTVDQNTARVSGYVDSENGFGANLRSDYVCTVTHTSGDNWHLDDLQMT